MKEEGREDHCKISLTINNTTKLSFYPPAAEVCSRANIPKPSVCFDSHCIYLKFPVADILVDCILGNVFLAAVEPHGSLKLKGGKGGYCISVPTCKGVRKKIELPYISNPKISTMVHKELDTRAVQRDAARSKLVRGAPA